MAASNTRDAFREIVGKKIVGVLFDALPLHRIDLSTGNKTLVFEDGSGFTISNSGAFWQESPGEIQRAIGQAKDALEAARKEIEGVLSTAGALGVTP